MAMNSKMQFSNVTRRTTLLGMAGLASALAVRRLVSSAEAQPQARLTWGKPLEATLYDPHVSILASSWELLHQVYDGLVGLDKDMKPVPALAESWTQPDSKTYVFKLRSGAKFSNGREVTAQDVVGSLERLLDPKTGSFFRLQMGKVSSIKADGEGQVVVQLEEPYAPFLSALGSTMASIIPMKELADGSFDPTKALLGAGPYMVTSHVQGDRWELDRNPHYWQAGFPKVDKLILRIMPSDQALIAALRDGSIDIASFNANPDAPLLLADVQNLKIVQNPVSNLFLLVLNAVAKDSPFSDLKLRQAVALSIDRDKIRDVAFGGNTETTSVMPPLFEAVKTDELPLFKRDTAKAMTLLQEANVTNLRFPMLIQAEPVWQQMGQIIKESLAEVGLTVDLETVDEGVATKRTWIDNPGTFQAALLWYAGYSDPAMLPLWWDPGLAGFTAGYTVDDPALNKLIADTRALALDDPARPAALQSLSAAIDLNANVIPLVTRPETVAFRVDQIKAELEHKDGYADTLWGLERYERV